VTAALIVCIGASACGSAERRVERRRDIGSITVPFYSSTVVAGTSSFLVIENNSESHRVVELHPTQAELKRADVRAIKVQPTTYFDSGLQLDDGRWVALGRRCDIPDDIVQKDFDAGEVVVAVLDNDRWSVVDDIPAQLTSAHFALAGAHRSTVVVERWDRGDSRYWLLDLATGEFRALDWKPPALELDLRPRSDVEIIANEPRPVRESCVTQDQLLVVDGRPVSGGLRSHLWLVDLDSGQVLAERDLALHPSIVQDVLLCRPDGLAHLVGVDRDDNRPSAYRLEHSTITDTMRSPVSGDEITVHTVGRSSVTFQFLSGERPPLPGTTAIAPTDEHSTNDPTTDPPVTLTRPTGSPGTVKTVAFVNEEWRDLSELVDYFEKVSFTDDGRYALVTYDRRSFRSITLD
jgi:hypothetical protein